MVERLTSSHAPKAIGCYSPASRVGNLIFTSGQLGIKRQTGQLVADDIVSQTTQAMTNLRYILEENGTKLDNIVKTTVYLKDIADFKAFDQAYKTFFTNAYPSRTAFEVGNLPMNAKVEIEVIASVE